MSLRLTAGSSRVKKSKPTKSPLCRSSPFASSNRIKPLSRPTKRPSSALATETTPLTGDDVVDDGDVYHADDTLSDLGPSNYISQTLPIDNVIQAIQYIRNSMFAELPTSRAGMNSTRIADVLNFRRALPPIVSVAHVHMLIDAPTKVEKEILSLVENGVVRRLLIPGRAGDAAALGDCLILMDDWKEMVRVSSALKQSLKDKFIALLSSDTKTSSVSTSALPPEEVSALVRSGFLVSPSAIAKSTSANPDITSVSVQSSSPSSTPPAIAAAAEGTTSKPAQKFRDASMFLSIPNLGAYLRLLSAARTRLLAMLKKSSFNEAPLYLLRDRWNGAVEVSTPHEVAKRIRGESTGVLPGRTKMWKELYGLSFRWCLEEALGAGLIEIFETGSVGPAVRSV